MAPEVAAVDRFDEKVRYFSSMSDCDCFVTVNYQADVYGFAVLAWEIMHGFEV
jgi:hypothetical protein